MPELPDRPTRRFTARLEQKPTRPSGRLGRTASGRLLAALPRNSGPTFAETTFAVVDMETTGVLPSDRIVELAIVRFSGDGRTCDQWSTLLNPGRDLGACRVHRLLDWADVRHAPRFADVAGDVIDRLRGSVVVAHSLQFEQRFFRYEFGALGLELPDYPALCTLRLAVAMGAQSRQLMALCRQFGIPLRNAHSALSDAWATARLLSVYMAMLLARGAYTLGALEVTTPHPPLSAWPRVSATGRAFDRTMAEAVPETERPRDAEPVLAHLVRRLPAGESEAEVEYLDLLDRVLADFVLSAEEAQELLAFADEAGLQPERVARLHASYLLSLVSAAWQDGQVTPEERRQLEAVAAVLAVPRGEFEDQLREPGVRPEPSPTAVPPGEPLPGAEDGRPSDPLGRLLALCPPGEGDW